MSQWYAGTPRLYRRIAIGVSATVHAYIFVGFATIKYLVQGENWYGVWQLPLSLAASGAIVAFFHYRWMMRLDAQYGNGSRWIMKSAQVTLPELKVNRRPPGDNSQFS